eukprot:scaffold70212_cov72-Phaeocystis_antarctica.AAC.2
MSCVRPAGNVHDDLLRYAVGGRHQVDHLTQAAPHDRRNGECNGERREQAAGAVDGHRQDCNLDRQLWHFFQAHDQEPYSQHEAFVGQPVIHGGAFAPRQQAQELHVGERDQQDERVESRQLLQALRVQVRRAKHHEHLAGARSSGQQHKEQQQSGNDLLSSGAHDSQPLHGEGDVGQGVTRCEQRAEDVRTRQLDSDLGVGSQAQHGHS